MTSIQPATAAPPHRLALVITELWPGGAERCLVELATRLDRAKFEPVVYSLAPPPPSDRRMLVDRLVQSQIPTQFLGLTRFWQYQSAVTRLAAAFREQRPAVVQTFLFHANIVGTQAAKAAGIGHVVTGMRVADPRWWRTASERWLTGAADRHICVSQNVAEYYRHRGFASEKLAVIPNGVILERWMNAPAIKLSNIGVSAGRKALLYVGRLDPQKGLDQFFRELPRLFRELPHHDFVLVGEGPQRAELGHLAGFLGIHDRVHFVGWRDDVPAIMAACDAVVLPSRWEGMPNVVLEAMAAGKPVVASQAEGVVELLGLAAIEQTAALGDWAGLRSKLEEIVGDEKAIAALGSKNQGRAQQFSVENMVLRYERTFSNVLHSGR